MNLNMNCIICQDNGQEPILDNKYCDCKYKIHNSCWIDYVNSQKQLKCLMCRKDISTCPKTKSAINNQPPNVRTPLRINQSLTPYTAPLIQNQNTIGGTPITYQEFAEIVRASTLVNENDNVVIYVNSISTQTNLSSIARNQNSTPATYHSSCPSFKQLIEKYRKILILLLLIIVLGLIFSGIIYMS
jgi:hypothetical protein